MFQLMHIVYLLCVEHKSSCVLGYGHIKVMCSRLWTFSKVDNSVVSIKFAFELEKLD